MDQTIAQLTIQEAATILKLASITEVAIVVATEATRIIKITTILVKTSIMDKIISMANKTNLPAKREDSKNIKRKTN